MRHPFSFRLPILAGFFLLLGHVPLGHADNCADLLARLLPKGPTLPLTHEQIHYQVYGERNSETLVLIHGLGSSGDTWDDVVRDLAKNYKVIVYDQRGHGQTAAIGENYSSGVMAADLLSLLDHIGVRQANLLGHSMGARTAISFAEKNPQRVKSVIFEDMHMVGRRTALPDNREIARRMKADLPESYPSEQQMLEALSPFFSAEEAEEIVLRSAERNRDGTFRLNFRPDVVALYSNHGLQEDFSQALRQLRVPTLFLQADPAQGAVLWGKGLKHIEETLPDATVVGFPGAGHTIHSTKRDPFLRTVKGFLSGRKIEDSPLEGGPPRP